MRWRQHTSYIFHTLVRRNQQHLKLLPPKWAASWINTIGAVVSDCIRCSRMDLINYREWEEKQTDTSWDSCSLLFCPCWIKTYIFSSLQFFTFPLCAFIKFQWSRGWDYYSPVSHGELMSVHQLIHYSPCKQRRFPVALQDKRPLRHPLY